MAFGSVSDTPGLSPLPSYFRQPKFWPPAAGGNEVHLLAGVLADVADVHVAGAAVEAGAEQVAEAVGEDLLAEPGGVPEERIVRGDGVVIVRIGRQGVWPGRVDPQHLAQQHGAVLGVLHRVVAAAAVAGVDVKEVVRPEPDPATIVIGLTGDVAGEREDTLRAADDRPVRHGEPVHPRLAGGGTVVADVIDVDRPVAVAESGSKSHAEQALFCRAARLELASPEDARQVQEWRCPDGTIGSVEGADQAGLLDHVHLVRGVTRRSREEQWLIKSSGDWGQCIWAPADDTAIGVTITTMANLRRCGTGNPLS